MIILEVESKCLVHARMNSGSWAAKGKVGSKWIWLILIQVIFSTASTLILMRKSSILCMLYLYLEPHHCRKLLEMVEWSCGTDHTSTSSFPFTGANSFDIAEWYTCATVTWKFHSLRTSYKGSIASCNVPRVLQLAWLVHHRDPWEMTVGFEGLSCGVIGFSTSYGVFWLHLRDLLL